MVAGAGTAVTVVSNGTPRRRGPARWAAAAGLFAAAVALTLGAAPDTTASAAPKPTPTKSAAKKPAAPKPEVIKIVGDQVSDPIVVKQAEQSRLYGALYDEFAWIGTADAQTGALPADKLGPKYTVTIATKDDKALQVFDLYPLAAGGPRAHRPQNEPTGLRADAWVYGRLTMSEALRISGVPLKAKTDVVPGGVGGGIGTDINVREPSDPVDGVNSYFSQIRRLFLLNGAVIVLVMFGLAGVAFLIRRKV
jgi:hypothetical protein